MDRIAYVTKLEGYNAGGNCMVDLVHLSDGRVIAINDESLALFKSAADFYSEEMPTEFFHWFD